MKKLISLLLVLCMLLGMSVNVWAEGDTITIYFRNKIRSFDDPSIIEFWLSPSSDYQEPATDVSVWCDDQSYLMSPVSGTDYEYWMCELPTRYVGTVISFGSSECEYKTYITEVPGSDDMVWDMMEFDFQNPMGNKNEFWFPAPPCLGDGYHELAGTDYRCKHCFVDFTQSEGLMLSQNEKFLLKNVGNKDLEVVLAPGAEIVKGSSITAKGIMNIMGTISDSTVNADIINLTLPLYGKVSGFPVLNNVDCGGYNVFNQWYISGANMESGRPVEAVGSVTWADTKESSLTLKYYTIKTSSPASLEDSIFIASEMLVPFSSTIGMADVNLDTDALPGAADANSKTWSWPSAEWLEKLPTPEPMSADESAEDAGSLMAVPYFTGFTVPAGYKLSVAKTDYTLTKEAPKEDPAVEEDTSDDNYYEEVEEDNHISSSDMSEIIEETPKNATEVTIDDVNEDTTISKKAMEKAIEEGLDIEFEGDDYTLILKTEDADFSGFKGTFNPYIDTDANCTTSMKSELKKNDIDPAHVQVVKTEFSGKLPGKMVLEILLDKELRGGKVYFYYWNAELKQYELIPHTVKGNKIIVSLSHFSTYIVTNEPIVGAIVEQGAAVTVPVVSVDKANPETGAGSHFFACR